MLAILIAGFKLNKKNLIPWCVFVYSLSVPCSTLSLYETTLERVQSHINFTFFQLKIKTKRKRNWSTIKMIGLKKKINVGNLLRQIDKYPCSMTAKHIREYTVPGQFLLCPHIDCFGHRPIQIREKLTPVCGAVKFKINIMMNIKFKIYRIDVCPYIFGCFLVIKFGKVKYDGIVITNG
jgi:hypothetical protein